MVLDCYAGILIIDMLCGLSHSLLTSPLCFVSGSGTTLLAAKKCGRNFIGIDTSHKYKGIFQRRCSSSLPGVDEDPTLDSEEVADPDQQGDEGEHAMSTR